MTARFATAPHTGSKAADLLLSIRPPGGSPSTTPRFGGALQRVSEAALAATLPIEPRNARKRLVSGPTAPRPPSLPGLPRAAPRRRSPRTRPEVHAGASKARRATGQLTAAGRGGPLPRP